MTIDEAKTLLDYAKELGCRSFKFGELEAEFYMPSKPDDASDKYDPRTTVGMAAVIESLKPDDNVSTTVSCAKCGTPLHRNGVGQYALACDCLQHGYTHWSKIELPEGPDVEPR